MRRVVWWVTGVLLVLWSIFAFVTHGVVDFVGTTASTIGTTPGFPAEPLSAQWFASQLRGLGTNFVFMVWLAGSIVLMGVATLVHKLTGARKAKVLEVGGPRSWGSSIPSRPADRAGRSS